MFPQLMNTMTRVANWAQANQSEIEFWGGVTCIAAGGVAQAVGGWKAHQVWLDRLDEECELADNLENEDGIEETAIDREITKHRIGTCAKIGVNMLPGAALTAIGIGLVAHSHNMQAAQIVALTGAYNSLLTLHNRYKQKVAEKFGEKAAQEIDEELVKDQLPDGSKFSDMSLEEICTMLCGGNDTDPTFLPYTAFTCDLWTEDRTANLRRIYEAMEWAQRELDTYGVVWLIDVLKVLGIRDAEVKYPMARFVGWTRLGPVDPRDGKDDGRQRVIVDFGLEEEANDYAGMDWLKNKDQNQFILHFNHMGVITDIVGTADPLAA